MGGKVLGTLGALREAGYRPNELVRATSKTTLLTSYAELARELGRLPASTDLRLRARRGPFPSHGVFAKLGSKTKLVQQLAQFCKVHGSYDDVLQMCEQYVPLRRAQRQHVEQSTDDTSFGFVYLLKSGRNYKIGHSNSVGRRQYELKIQLPDAAELVHDIRTDDPPGIEAYWHKRFDAKRKNGEWFNLNATDVAAFKRRKFM
ncbi:MAG: GIY-YIG nuclease family protein [Pirellulales bacterium]